MRAIFTTYKGPAGARGARICATDCEGSASIPYPHGAHHDAKRMLAARVLHTRHKLTGYLLGPVNHPTLAGVEIFLDSPEVAELVAAAYDVLDHWEKGDLAAAVRALAAVLERNDFNRPQE